MSYGHESKGPMFAGIGANDVAPFHANAVNCIVEVLQPCTILNVGAMLGANAASDNMTLTITRNITPGSTTNNVAVAVLTIPSTATVGKIYHANVANFTPQDANAGDELKFAMSANGGGATWIPWIEAVPRAQVKANNNDFVAVTPA